MTRTSKIILTTALALGLIGGVAAYGKHRFGDPTRIGEHMVERVSDELELNDTQVQSLQSLVDELLKVKTQMTADLGADREALRELIVANHFDQGRALDMLSAKTTAIQDNAAAVIAALGSFLDDLTPAQKTELAEHMEHHRRHHHGRHSDVHEDNDEHRNGHRASQRRN